MDNEKKNASLDALRAKAAEWPKSNSKTISPEHEKLRCEFLERFPKERLDQMTLADYAIGDPNHPDSFCYWIEFKTKALGSILGGSARKFGVYWSTDLGGYWAENGEDPEVVFSRIRDGIVESIRAMEEGRLDELDALGDQYLQSKWSLRIKPLTLYYPETFFPVFYGKYLDQFIYLLGGTPVEGQTARNLQLASLVRSSSIFEGFDFLQAMLFLYGEVPRPNIWRISPGSKADQWEECLKNGTIVIGWHKTITTDMLKLSKDQLTDIILGAGYEGKTGGATIWRFIHEVMPGDIVVANLGTSKVVGIGRVVGDYLPADDPNNPSTDSEFRQARWVDWLVPQALEFSPPIFPGLPGTMSSLKSDSWQRIKDTYLREFPNDEAVRSAFVDLEMGSGALEGHEKFSTIPSVGPPKELAPLMDVTSSTSNVILYGAPGTGKTWTASHFANYYLLHHNVSPAKAAQYWQAVISGDESLRGSLESEARMVREGRGFWWLSGGNKLGFGWTELLERGEAKVRPYAVGSPLQVQVDPGDLVIGYQAHNREIVCLAEVVSSSGGEVNLRLLEQLRNPVSLDSVKGLDAIPQDHAIRGGLHTGNFRLSPEESAAILRLIGSSGNQESRDSVGARALEFVTFHQSFAYEEFVEGLRPRASQGQLSYAVEAGIFRRIAERAREAYAREGKSAMKFILVIDEINRANIAKVLGELITLIEDDKRIGQKNAVEVRLPYSGERFSVPPNLLILGTMNTADRSIALLDLALRRRFTFLRCDPDLALLRGRVVAGVNLQGLMRRLNQRIRLLIDEDHELGQSYFLNVDSESKLEFAWNHRILPLLLEYFHRDLTRLQALLGNDFVRRVEWDSEGGDEPDGWDDLVGGKIEVRHLWGAGLSEALRRLSG